MEEKMLDFWFYGFPLVFFFVKNGWLNARAL
jgi:hypothetical protein